MDRADDVDRLTKQLADVQSDSVAFSKQRIMSSNGEVALFYAARTVTGQTAPNGDYPFYVFPQVSLGELVRTSPKTPSAARRSKDAYLAINSKRCDIVLADNTGLPVAVFEYQGAGHHSGTASLRDEVKRLAVTRAGIRFVEIPDGAGSNQIRSMIRDSLPVAAPPPTTGRL